MFTGIVRAMGVVTGVARVGGSGDGVALGVNLGGLLQDRGGDGEGVSGVGIGDSVAVNGACLTVCELNGGDARFDVSGETLRRCLVGEWGVGTRVNLEAAIGLQTLLGGHLMAGGHVDGVGEVVGRREEGNGVEMEFFAPREIGIGRLIAVKGAIAVDGVSLTVNGVEDTAEGTRFSVMVVPHTLAETTLGELAVGGRVHLEADMVARYVERWSEATRKAGGVG